MIKKRDKRKKRQLVTFSKRRRPYIYPYEVAEAAIELGISAKQLQQYINDHYEDIRNEPMSDL